MRCLIVRGTNEDHVAVGFMDVTRETIEQRKRLLGAIPLSPDVLTKANIGLWAFELDEGEAPRMYADEAMLPLIGLDHQVSPEETYHAWYDNIDDGSYGLVAESVEKMTSGEHAEVQYPWHHPDGRTMIVRCGGVRNFEYKKGIRIEAGKLEITNSPMDIREAISNVDLMSQSLALTKDIEYKTTIGKINNPYIYADELHVNQVLVNLISNAVKYTNAGGNVEYTVEQITK